MAKNRPFHLAFWGVFATIAPACWAGATEAWHRTPQGAAGQTATHRYELAAWGDAIVRVRIAPIGEPLHRSYALEREQAPAYRGARVALRGSARDGVLVLRTPAATVELSLPGLRVRLLDAQGRVLAEDAAGGGLVQHGAAFTVRRAIRPGEHYAGLGEALGDLDRRGSIVPLRNTDTWRYGDPAQPMYGSFPFYMGFHDGLAYGVFLDNSHPMRFDFGASDPGVLAIDVEGGERDEFLVAGATPADVLRGYATLTGRMPLPPKWALGFQQSRCSYYPESEVRFIALGFRTKRIPLDGIVLDADYLHGYEPFRIDERRFPDLAGLARELAAQGIELTASVNPGIAIDESYAAYRDGLASGVFLRHADGRDYVADMWPNTIRLPDFTSARVRAWWSAQLALHERLGIHGTWTDMNEPAIGTKHVDADVRFDFDGSGATAAEAGNVYALQMARASHEAPALAGSTRRPFVLSRSGFAGIQRYAAMWSGDNQANDAHLMLGTLLAVQMGLVGLPMSGPDVGGYIGDGDKALYRRWIEVGALLPYLRAHREHAAAANEPWGYGEEDEAIAREWIGFRYRLMPYLYSVVREAAATGLPIVRSPVLEWPGDAHAWQREFQTEFLLGGALLAQPMASDELHKRTWLPPGTWYDLFTDRAQEGGAVIEGDYAVHRLPLFARASAIVPMQRLVQSTAEDAGDTLDLHVWAGREPGHLDYYEDDGATTAWQGGDYHLRAIDYLPAQGELRFAPPTGRRAAHVRHWRIVLHGFPPLASATANGRPVAVSRALVRPIDPLAGLEEVYYDPAAKRTLREAEAMEPQQLVEVDNAPGMVVRWEGDRPGRGPD